MPQTLRHRLQACLATGSKADKALASYMLAQMASLPFETAASLAEKVAVSEPTVGRFCRTLGYRSLKDLKASLAEEIGDRPWLISDRMRDFQQRSLAGDDQLARSLQLEIAGLVRVYELAQSEEWKRVARRLATASSVYVTGFQTERGLAQYLANQLQYLRDGVHLVDLAAGNFSELLLSAAQDRCLVIFEARRYSRLARALAEQARAAGIPTTLITDSFCDWGRGLVDEMLVVSTEFNLFWDSTAQMANLGNLLINAVFVELGPQVEQRLNRMAELYGRFTGHVGAGSGPPG
ncbi:MurR/RpiR family transcriptional regulator [Bosea sp. (in: a-proteobacteria)]|uniref:MurR/RpiR family transcriptional regulator n=1 Tax=Bosea sp. (in: a-proteobacteria) TaxID=1871050 RepID=UPI003B3B0ACB